MEPDRILLLVAGAGNVCVVVGRQQLSVLVPVVMVDMFVLKILRGDVLKGFPRLVVVVKVLGDRVRVLVVSHLQGHMDFDVLSSYAAQRYKGRGYRIK